MREKTEDEELRWDEYHNSEAYKHYKQSMKYESEARDAYRCARENRKNAWEAVKATSEWKVWVFKDVIYKTKG